MKVIGRLGIVFQKIVGLMENIAFLVVVDSTIAVSIEAGDSIAHFIDVDTLQSSRSKRDEREDDDEEVHFTFCRCLLSR